MPAAYPAFFPLLLPWYLVLNTNYEEPLQAVCFIFWSLLPSLIENLPLHIVSKHSRTVVFPYFETPSVSLLLCCTCYKGWVGLQNWRPGFDKHYSRVSFYDGSFYDDSLLRPLSSRTEHSRLVVHHCRNSSVLSLLSTLLALFRCACVSSFFHFSAVLSSWLWFFQPWRLSKRQKRRKNQKSWRYILSWCLLNHSLGLLQQNKK